MLDISQIQVLHWVLNGMQLDLSGRDNLYEKNKR